MTKKTRKSQAKKKQTPRRRDIRVNKGTRKSGDCLPRNMRRGGVKKTKKMQGGAAHCYRTKEEGGKIKRYLYKDGKPLLNKTGFNIDIPEFVDIKNKSHIYIPDNVDINNKTQTDFIAEYPEYFEKKCSSKDHEETQRHKKESKKTSSHESQTKKSRTSTVKAETAPSRSDSTQDITTRCYIEQEKKHGERQLYLYDGNGEMVTSRRNGQPKIFKSEDDILDKGYTNYNKACSTPAVALAVAPTPALAADWVEHFSASKQRKYWKNSTTGESTWKDPNLAPRPDRTPAPTPAPTPALDAEWEEKYSEEKKRTYWKKLSTGIKQWENPYFIPTPAEDTCLGNGKDDYGRKYISLLSKKPPHENIKNNKNRHITWETMGSKNQDETYGNVNNYCDVESQEESVEIPASNCQISEEDSADIVTKMNFAIENKCTDLITGALSSILSTFSYDLNTQFGKEDEDNKKTALIIAIEFGITWAAQKLIEKGAGLTDVDAFGETALMYASEKGHADIVNLLIEKKANVDAVDEGKKTALMYASENGHTDIVNLLLSKSATSVNLEDAGNEHGGKGKKTALMYASEKGHTQIVNTLIENGADITSLTAKQKTDLLIPAITDGKNIAAIMLIGNGADITGLTTEQKTGLLIPAITKGKQGVAKILIENGADIKSLTPEQKTGLLTHAVEETDKKYALLLIKSGVAITTLTPERKTSLLIPAIDDVSTLTQKSRITGVYNVSIAKMLIDAGANVNVVDGSSKTALMHAAEKGNEEVVTALIKKGANVNAVDSGDKTALSYTTDENITRLLTTRKVEYDKTLSNLFSGNFALSRTTAATIGENDLINAIKGKNPTALTLIVAGANVDVIESGTDKTALMYAAEKGNLDVVRALIAKGANVNVIDNSGKTALMYAIDKKDTDSAKLLINANAPVTVSQLNSLLSLVATTGKDPKFENELVKKGASYNIHDLNLLLKASIETSKVDRAIWFIDKGADVNATDRTSKPILLDIAITNKLLGVANKLIEKGAIPTELQLNALLAIAIVNNSMVDAHRLIKKGAKPSSDQFNLLLNIAIEKKSMVDANYLIGKIAEPTQPQFNLLLNIAIEKKSMVDANKFIEKGAKPTQIQFNALFAIAIEKKLKSDATIFYKKIDAPTSLQTVQLSNLKNIPTLEP